ncbi:CHAD domain-containing protein [Phenylobacterium sp.]|uniref:CYTH and CHAD domain-containing protein n=1 Tax=Phenylobacterium sp. TaxID=1871053 RepID=UPI002C3B9838|nr:CHAD domain-containing protein [Phenylobacterium sp.]HVI31833.1 CHAD domain-containing protein [Phenylobacterium sp.]
MSGSHEIELKFLCAPEDLGSVLAAAPAGDDDTRELISVYFDTPDLALQKAGVSLRVRESKGRKVQTLKRGDGLAREEHEEPVEGDRPTPDLGPLRELLPDGGADALKPAFNVHVTRRQRLVRYHEAEIELALDQGEVRGGQRASPISEVELELKSGRPEALFELARELGEAAPLYLSFDGKASRGQALVAGAPLQARRKERVELASDASTAAAFQAVARNALGQIAANAVVLRESPDPEAVHQLRVAVRRLRSALSTFAPVVRDDTSDSIRAELRWLAHACNDARDLDVFAQRMGDTARGMDPPPAGLPALQEAVQAARGRASAAAAEAVASARFRTLMIDVTAWLETGAWLSDPARAALRGTPARTFADEALEARRRKLLKRGRDLKHADDTARHDTRLEAKKLRYTGEAFASLYPDKATGRFLRALKDLQEELGALNDLAVAEPLVARLTLAQDAAVAAGELIGVQACEKPRRIEAADRALRRLAKVDRFWR